MFKRGDLVVLKDKLYSQIYYLDFQNKELYEMYFGVEGVVVDFLEDSIFVVFDREIEKVDCSYLEKRGGN